MVQGACQLPRRVIHLRGRRRLTVVREEFMAWFTDRLVEAGATVGRWQAGPDLEDLQIQIPGGRPVRLRIVRTSPTR